MGISTSQVCRIRQGKRNINLGFIIGATMAFPEYKLDDLFYVALDNKIAMKLRQKLSADTTIDSGDMLTTGDVADLLNLHVNTVRRWADRGILKAYRLGSRNDRRFRREDVLAFLWKKKGRDLLDTPE